MREGVIEIILSSIGSARLQDSYFVFFVPYRRAGGSLRARPVSGVEALREFLAGLGIEQSKIDGAVVALSGAKSASIDEVTLSDEQFQGFTQSWG